MEKIKRYINELEKNSISVQEVILFGSYAKGNPVETSDIDIAVISAAFSGDRFDDRRLMYPTGEGSTAG
ncbi:nucleotidyltransferase domain-containing protein [Candidatus Magnetobacterium casense]|uniref:nucleotidyltransferase domain-containing protein n=1 Tax=Candidatus Magnetobacterium casense TaxID=1455061 RepID=UPI001C4786CC|nr:nucleotidyltransferase domain-containing protein [Candidatus Magnetobacterium casensis]